MLKPMLQLDVTQMLPQRGVQTHKPGTNIQSSFAEVGDAFNAALKLQFSCCCELGS